MRPRSDRECCWRALVRICSWTLHLLLLCPRNAPTTLTQRSWTLQLLLRGPRNASATLLAVAIAASGATQSSCNAPGRCNWCFWGHAILLQRSQTLQLLLLWSRDAPATISDAASAVSMATRRSCKAAGRCNCCFWDHALLLQRSQKRHCDSARQSLIACGMPQGNPRSNQECTGETT